RSAIAILSPTVNQTAGGTVEFVELTDPKSGNLSVRVIADLVGLVPGSSHGFHIHAFGDTSSAKGEYTYGHFNPFKRNHTCEPTLGHVGDFGNVTADDQGRVSMKWQTTALSFNSSVSNYLIGRGVMIHASPDDCVTAPTGNAGGRISQGPIGWSSEDGASTSRTPTRRRRAPVTPADAIAVLVPIANSGVSGSIFFYQSDPLAAVQVAVNVSGLSPSENFAMRVLTLGDMSNPAGPPTDISGVFPPSDVCKFGASGLGLASDASGRVIIMPKTEGGLAVRGLSIYADSPLSILGRGLALYVGGFDCDSSTNVKAFLAQSVIAIRNGTLSPTFSPMTQASTTAVTTIETSTAVAVTSTAIGEKKKCKGKGP
ncbi:hypothetical protein HDU67_009104, partial [Dinochytrium kinnereticum]